MSFRFTDITEAPRFVGLIEMGARFDAYMAQQNILWGILFIFGATLLVCLAVFLTIRFASARATIPNEERLQRMVQAQIVSYLEGDRVPAALRRAVDAYIRTSIQAQQEQLRQVQEAPEAVQEAPEAVQEAPKKPRARRRKRIIWDKLSDE